MTPARRRRRERAVRRLATVLVVLCAGVLLTATEAGEEAGLPDLLGARREPVPPAGVTAEQLDAARAALDRLPVKGRAPRTGYARDEFGRAWADVDGNGCDTRNDVLARDLTDVVLAEDGCTVLSGVLVDPYSGETIEFERGERSAEVQIDHVVPLSDAWQKGAQRWSAEKRRLFANDPANLLAVDGDLNQLKGAGDTATWLPPRRGFRCRYAMTQVEVKDAYGLWVTEAERDAMRRELDRCEVVTP